jgi:predicted nucleic acid-binding protein
MRYFDTGVLLKLYLPEPNASQAVALVVATGAPPPLTAVHRLEMISALHQKQGRGEISASDCLQIQANLDLDVAANFYDTSGPIWADVFQRAEALARQHTGSTLCRSLDTLHVALALELGATEFCTFDIRQSTMARLTGLTVLP